MKNDERIFMTVFISILAGGFLAVPWIMKFFSWYFPWVMSL